MALDKETREIITKDAEGNTWKITMSKMETKTNRFELMFWFNEKKFSLSKLQSNRSADDTWELLQKIKKSGSVPEVVEVKESATAAKERPKKRGTK